MRLNERVIGTLAILGGCAIIYGTFGFRSVPGQQFGSAFFPRIVGAAAILAGIIQIATATPGPKFVLPGWMLGRSAIGALGVIFGTLLWLVVVDTLGFMATTAILITALALLLGGRPLIALMVGLGMTGAFHLIFATLLRVPLPRGLIEAALL